MSTTNNTVYKSIEIPARLRDDDRIRYILIKKTHEDDTLKRPKENGWQIKNNYPANAPKLLGWLRGGGNYGVLTGVDGLAIFDADELDRLRELGVIDALPNTFTARTGGEGEHHYFWIEGLQGKIVFFDKTLLDEDGKPLHLGEVLSKRNFAIGPNSNHRSGRKYEVINDAPIAELSYEKLIEILTPVNTKKKDTTTKRTHTESSIDIRIEQVAWPLNATESIGSNGREVTGEHPLHGATKAKDRGKSRNFSINTDKNVWTCRACESGGGPLEWLAVAEGIISCAEAGKGCLDKEKFKRVLRVAEEKGLIQRSEKNYKVSDSKSNQYSKCSTEEECYKQIESKKKESSDDVINAETVPETTKSATNRLLLQTIPTDMPPDGVTGLRASPRRGKTHHAAGWMVQMGEGNFITHRHAIIKHAIRSFKEQGGRDFIWVEGRGQPGMCRLKRSTCVGCSFKPNGFAALEELKDAARAILKRDRFLTKDNVPMGMCPYYTLKFAEPYASYCFTVVNNVPVIGKHGITPRKITIFDEDTTLQHFYTPSVEMAKVKIRRGERHVVNGLVDLDEDVREILEKKKQPGLRVYAKKIKEISDALEEIDKTGIDVAVEKITTCLSGWAPARKYVRDEPDEDHVTLGAMVNCLSNLYSAKPVVVTSSRGGYKTVHLLGDARAATINEEWWLESKKIVIIGATLMERMVTQLGGTVWTIDGFPYADRFVVIPIDVEKGEGRGKLVEQKKKVLEIVKLLAGDGGGTVKIPAMILCGSKAVQRAVMAQIGEDAHGSTTDQEEQQMWNYTRGQMNVFYQNSIISRGLDVDQYSLLAAYDSNFAQPFWGEVDEGIAREITKDETTNSVLRISPTKRNDNEKARIILIPKDDLWKVQYLEGRVAKVQGSAGDIAVLLQKLKAGGEIIMGKSVIEATDSGIMAEGALAKVELASIDGELVPETAIAVTSAMVIDFMKTKSDSWVVTRDIVAAIHIQRGVTVATLRHLYRTGELEVDNRKKGTYWRKNDE